MQTYHIEQNQDNSDSFNQTTLELYKSILVERYKQVVSQVSADS